MFVARVLEKFLVIGCCQEKFLVCVSGFGKNFFFVAGVSEKFLVSGRGFREISCL